MPTLKDFIDSRPKKNLSALPLVHITTWQWAEKILKSGLIEPRKCDDFSAITKIDEILGYWYYGRPAFRPKPVDANGSIHHYPIAFILRYEPTVFDIIRVFPFDTGAYIRKYYESVASSMYDYELLEYIIGGAFEDASRHISAFFSDNSNYLRGRLAAPISFDNILFPQVSTFLQLLQGDPKGSDDRRSSIEVQVKGPVTLDKSNVIGIVVPENFMDSAFALRLIKTFLNGGDPDFYVDSTGVSSEWYGALRQVATQIILRNI